MEIRRATIKDLPDILDIQKKAFVYEAELHNDFTIQPLTQTLEELEQEFKKGTKTVFVYIENGKIIGSVRGETENDMLWVQKLVVHPDYQKRGIGSALMNALENSFKNVKKYILFTGEKSERNIRFYSNRGYNTTNYNGKFYDNVHLIFMEKINNRHR